MSLPQPCTPTRSVASPFTSSASPSAYLTYPCSSPTPLPSTDAQVPAEISPHYYQLTHPGLASTPRPPIIPFPTSNSYNWSTANKFGVRDASSALKPCFRTFSTLTAAETLLSVQLGPPPSSVCPSSLSPDGHTKRIFWDTTSQEVTGALGKEEAYGADSHRDSAMLISPSSLDQVTSSSQPTATSWHEPRTPSRRGPHGRRAKDFPLPSSPDIPFSPTLRHSCDLSGYKTPRAFRFRGSFPSTFDDDFEVPYPGLDPTERDTLTLCTPEGPKAVLIEDVSPVLRQSQQNREDILLQGRPNQDAESHGDSDRESGLYASQSGSYTLVALSSPVLSPTKDDFTSSEDDIPLVASRSRVNQAPSNLRRQVYQVDSREYSGGETKRRPTSSQQPNRRRLESSQRDVLPMPLFGDRRILNNPFAVLSGTRMAKRTAECTIAALAGNLSPSSSPVKREHRVYASPSDSLGSPLSSIPSSPASDHATMPGVNHEGLYKAGMSSLEASPIRGKPTRAQTRALAAILRPHDASTISRIRSSMGSSKVGESVLRKRVRTKENTEYCADEPRKRTRVFRANSPAENEVVLETLSQSQQESRQVNLPRRTFSVSVPIHPSFPAFYRRFAAPKDNYSPSSLPGAVKNPPRSAFDLYTPRWVKGRGTTKVGLCPLCSEPPSRGGEGKKLWLSMKFSAFKCLSSSVRAVDHLLTYSSYHMQYYHGISPSTGLPFSPPVAFTTVNNTSHSKQSFKAKQEKSRIEQGKCHKCHKWVAVEGVKDVDVKVKEIFWWKHAASCHQRTTIVGEDDVFIEDDIYRAALAAEDRAGQDTDDEASQAKTARQSD